MTGIHYHYAFSEPHRITLCRPSASEKYLVDVAKHQIMMHFSHKTLRDRPALTWKSERPDVITALNLFRGTEPMQFSDWHRMEGGIPCFIATANEDELLVSVTGIATKLGLTVRLHVENQSNTQKDFTAVLQNRKGWVISNQGWIDGINTHLLLSMNDGRADRVIAYGVGADAYPILTSDTEVSGKNAVPMPDTASNDVNPKRALTSYLAVGAGETKTAYLIIPFLTYWEDLAIPTGEECEKLMNDAVREWTKLLDRGVKLTFSDSELNHCYRSCFADLFVMRERSSGKYWGITCGTDFYRSINSWEPLLSEIVLDRAGYTKEFERDVNTYLDGQDASGCWAYSKGWEHESWGVSFNKSRAVYTHYALTGDIEFLKKHYDKMLRSSRFNHAARQSTKHDKIEAFRGLMPRGMGDAGLMNGSDYYGVFYPANCQSVGADILTLKVAEILGKNEDIAELTAICEEARNDLIASLRNNVKSDGKNTYIPGIATADNSSLYGCLFSFYPCEILQADEAIVQSTLQYVQGKKISEGGLPVGTGWMKEGLWVAMALDNFASAYLRMGLYDDASALLYPVLNHASRFVTYCEERGAEAGSTEKSGDMQHLWTPLSVCAYMLDAVCFSDDSTIHLCSGLPRELLDEGKEISVKGLCTELGKMNLEIKHQNGMISWDVSFDRADAVKKAIILHLRTPSDTHEIAIRLQNGHSSGNIQSV